MTQETSTTTRHPFPPKLARQIQSQFSQFATTDLSGYTFERVKTDFYSAKSDLHIFNPDGKMVLMGRDFGDRTFFWQP